MSNGKSDFSTCFLTPLSLVLKYKKTNSSGMNSISFLSSFGSSFLLFFFLIGGLFNSLCVVFTTSSS
jgi:hypothetical protein